MSIYDSMPLRLDEWISPVIDTHLHFWNEKLIPFFFKWANLFFKDYSTVAMMPAELIKLLPENYKERIYIAQFLTTKNIGEYNAKELIEQIDKGYSDGVKIFKLWLAPRFLDNNKITGSFNLLDERLEPVFSRLEDYRYTVSAHIADPDLWYLFHYQNPDRYGNKHDNISRFLTIHENYPKIKFFATHFACWPENLSELKMIMEKHQNKNIKTRSTRWMKRELSRNPSQTKAFFEKFQDRIVFGTDLHVTREPMDPEYFTTRFWSHRMFWETDLEADLPFDDSDAPFGTHFKGLKLPKEILTKIYSTNFLSLFNK